MLRVLCALFLLAAGPGHADAPSPLAAVGLLQLGNGATCSGTLIAPDLVLTAAHCLRAERTGDALDPVRLRFRPGRSPGLPPPDGYRGRSSAVHPIYGFGIGPAAARMGFDFGLLRLATAISPQVARPLEMGALPAAGASVVIAGYRGGQGVLARQRRCPVIEANHAFAALGCPVDGGESGSPMLELTPEGPRVVGVLANKGLMEGQPVAFGPVTATAFATVLEHLENLESLANSNPSQGLEEAN